MGSEMCIRDRRGGFIYSKHELDRSSTAHSILEKTMDALIRPRLEAAIGGPVANLTDWFASAFQPGGLLGIHTDVGLGHVAFVLNLTPDDNAFRGGDLEFAEGHVAGSAEIKSARRVPARWRGGVVSHSRGDSRAGHGPRRISEVQQPRGLPRRRRRASAAAPC